LHGGDGKHHKPRDERIGLGVVEVAYREGQNGEKHEAAGSSRNAMKDAGAQKGAEAEQKRTGGKQPPEDRRQREGETGEKAEEESDDRRIEKAAPIRIKGLGGNPCGASGKVGGEGCRPLGMKPGPQEQGKEDGCPEKGGGDVPERCAERFIPIQEFLRDGLRLQRSFGVEANREIGGPGAGGSPYRVELVLSTD
jgi:hypothetical protein